MHGDRRLGSGLENAYQRTDCLSERGRFECPLENEVSQANLLCQGDLAADTSDGFGAGESVSPCQTTDLCFLICSNDDDLIHSFIDAGFEEERHIVDDDGFGIFSRGLSRESRLLTSDAGVDDAFQLAELGPVSEDDGSQRMAVEAAIRIEDDLAECLDDLPPGGLAWSDDLAGQFIGVDHDRAASLEHLGDRALAGGDPAREPYQDHGRGAYHAGSYPTRILIDISVPALV